MTPFNWTVPSSLSYISTYALSLSQNGPGSDVSPPFSIVGPSSLYNTAQPRPTIQNSTMAINGTLMALATDCTGTGAAVATSTYWDTICYCMKTAVAPMPIKMTSFPNYTTPVMAGSSMPTPSRYLISPHGGAARHGILLGRIGFLGVGFGLAMAASILA
jgi:hypothetical protein